MPSPEGREPLLNMSPSERLAASGLAFLVAVALAAPAPTSSEESKASPGEIDAAEIAKCKEENPSRPSTLTLNDYLNVERWGGGYHARPTYVGQEKKSLLEVARRRLRRNQLHAYEVSPERAKRVEAHVNRFAAGMVARANAGDETYKFLQGGGGAFLDGHFLPGPEGLKPADDNYEGFGWLEREVKGKEGDRLVRYEIADNIYRYSNGTYYQHPEPWVLGVQNNNAESTFEDPPALGLTACASLPGNGATQGWRVSYYGFNFDSPSNVQTEPWMDSGATISEVQLADRRAAHFVEDRYNPATP